MPASDDPAPPLDTEPPADLRRRVTSASGVTLLIFIADRVVQVGFLAILARILMPAEVAVSAAATLFVTLLALVVHMGVPAGLIQRPDLSERTVLTGRTMVLVTALGGVLVAEVCAPLVAAWFRQPQVADAVRLLAPLCFIQALTFAPHALLTRRLEARYLTLIDFVAGVVGQGLVAIPLAMLGWSYWALVAGTIAQALTRMAALNLTQPLPPRLAFHAAEARGLWGRGVGFSLSNLLQRLAHDSDRIVVGRYIGAVGLGLYARANGLMAFPAALYGAVADRVAFPAFAIVQSEPERLRGAYVDGMALTALIAAPMSVLLVILGPEVILFLLGPHWAGAIEPFRILSIAVFFRMADRVNGTLLRGVGRPYLLASVHGLVAAVMIVGSLAASADGIAAVAVVAAGASLLSNLLLTLAAMRAAKVGVGTLARAYQPAFASALLTALVAAPVAAFARAAGWEPLPILAVSGVVWAAAALPAVLLAPGLFLGPAGDKVLSTLFGGLSILRLRAGRP